MHQGVDLESSAGSARLEALSRYGTTDSTTARITSIAAGEGRKGSRWGGYADSAGTAIAALCAQWKCPDFFCLFSGDAVRILLLHIGRE
jgi:hypothetical protein